MCSSPTGLALCGASLALVFALLHGPPNQSVWARVQPAQVDSSPSLPVVHAGEPSKLLWPIEAGVSSFVTQSPAASGQAYPCGSGVNGQHILRGNAGDNEDYRESLDIVARARNAPEQSDEGRGTAVTSVADGRVVALNMAQNECDRPFGAGNYVVVEHPHILVDGKPLRSAYMHLNSTLDVEQAADCGINPRPTDTTDFSPPPIGSIVRAGDKIGELGNTGNSTGPHLHFQFASTCTLEPASDVDCPSIAVLDVNPSGFGDIRVARDMSCDSMPGIGGPGQPDQQSYLSDGSYVTTSTPPHSPQAISASVGGP